MTAKGPDEARRRIEQAGAGGGSALDLGGLRLDRVPDEIADLTGLTELLLNDNRITALPDWIGSLPNLTTLRLDSNRLAELPGTMNRLTSLTRLDVGQNWFTELPGWLGGLTGLTSLDLRGLQLRKLPDWLGGLSDLTELDIGSNQLVELPTWLSRHTRLTRLSASGNMLTEVPDWIFDLGALRKLTLHGIGLTELSARIADLNGLTWLYLGGNKLTSLPDRIGELSALTGLYLFNNDLVSVPDSLANLHDLAVLMLDANRLAELPSWISGMGKLTHLGISGLQLQALPAWIAKFNELTELRVDRNHLAELPDWLGQLGKLEWLNVSGNQLTELPNWIADLTCLVGLRVGGNQLNGVPDWISGLINLEHLDVSGSKLSRLPGWISGLTSLVILDVSDNKITELPDWISQLTDLRWLYLNNNQLGRLPDSIGRLTDLTFLDIDGNRLANLPDSVGNLSGLEDLYLLNNQLTRLPDSLGGLTSLAALVLGANLLEDLPDSLGSLTGLTYLNVADNQLTELPRSLVTATRLRTLRAGINQLSILPDWIRALRNLIDLGVGSNEITSLPDWLTEMPNLEEFSVYGNPLVSPPPEIAESGTSSVMAFLRARREGASEQWVSKLLVVGEGGVGKTSLIKALAGERHDPHESTTHGVRISDLAVDHPARSDVRMHLSTWDFGGQQIYHATHQFFLSNRSLFVLLWNSRLGCEQGRLRYWLDIIKARAPESPVLLVATHADSSERPVDLPLDELCDEYPRITRNIPVDSATGRGIEDLRAHLADEATGLPLMGAQWPTAWLAAAESLRNTTEKQIIPGRMWQLMAEAGVGDTVQQRYIAMALHHLGDILYYEDDLELAQTVVLRPEWVNEYISKVLDSDEVAQGHGVLTRSHLTELWSDLDRGMRDHFLCMMDRYDLSYPIDAGPGTDVSLVVERLSWSTPPYREAWEEMSGHSGNSEIRVLYQLNTMPPGIPTWFIARSHRFTTGTHWRTGVLLQHTDGRHRALLKADTHRNSVELAVRGPAPAAFFSILDDGFNRTLERFPGLDITRLVPCRCQDTSGGSCSGLFDYDDLQRRLQKDPPQHTIECHRSSEQQDVLRLLLGLAPSERATRAGMDRLLTMVTELSQKFDDKLDDQAEYLHKMDDHAEYLHLLFLKLQRSIQEQQEVRCPSVFALAEGPARRLRGAVGSTFELRLYCEEPGAWHRLPEGEGCYQISEPAEWLRKTGPYLKHLLTVLKHAAPLASPILGMTVAHVGQHLKADVEAMTQVVAQVPGEIRYEGLEAFREGPPQPSARASNEADFRVLHRLLIKLDPEERWGGLSRVTTPEGLTLYLCSQHSDSYRRPPRR